MENNSSTPLFDLHRHLDGSLRYQTLCALSEAQNGPEIPSEEDLRFYRGMGLQDALSRFQVTLSVLQSANAVARVASEMVEDAQREGLDYFELRFAPQLHLDDSIEKIVDAAIEGVNGKAGVILCGLYGEAPQVLQELVEVASNRRAVIGIDLAGGPSSDHSFSLEDYAPSFQKAGRLGLGRTVHASEGRPPDEIEQAITLLGANRIGHGTTLLEDPRIVQRVLENEITIEACPTSNVHVGAIDSIADHPIHEWIELGVRVVVCADNTLFSATNVPEELSRLGLNESERAFVSKCAVQARFERR